jgi:ComF family protein
MRSLLRFPTLLPSQCAVCHGWGERRVCATCLHRFIPPRPRCGRCALAVPPGVSVCGACLTAPPPFDRALAAVDYRHPWSALILQLKFNAGLELAGVLSTLLVEAALSRTAPLPDLLLPMPLSQRRLRERGFNQAWELARRLVPALPVPASAGVLLRVTDTPHQLAFPTERRAANVRGAFAVAEAHRAAVAGRCVALVDDVMTTGATAAEAARMLKQAGAARVEVWAVARTPRPGDNPAPCSTSSWSTPRSPPTRAT